MAISKNYGTALKKIYKGISVAADSETYKILFDCVKADSYKFCLYTQDCQLCSEVLSEEITPSLRNKYLLENQVLVPEGFFPSDYQPICQPSGNWIVRFAKCAEDFFQFAGELYSITEHYRVIFFNDFIPFETIWSLYNSPYDYKLIEVCSLYVSSGGPDGWICDIFSKNEIVIEQCKKKFIGKEIQTCRCMFDLDMNIVYEFEDWDIAPRKHIKKGFVCKKNKKFDFDACDNMSSSPFGIKLI